MEENKKSGISPWYLVIIMCATAILVYIGTTVKVTYDILNNPEKMEEAYALASYSGEFKKLNKVMGIVERDFLNEYDIEKLEEGAIRGMLEELDDPYTSYFNKSQAESFLTSTEGDYEGVGLYVTMDTEVNTAIVIIPIEGSPADEAGVQTGDYIIEIDGEDVVGVSIEEVASRLKGPKGSKVFVKFLRKNPSGDDIEIEKTLTRRKVELNTFESKVLEDNIGYIMFSSFDENVTAKFNKAFKELIQKQKVAGLIIDLRDNPGGLLNVATDIADKLLPEGKIVYTLDKNKNEEVIESDAKSIDIPIVVIINENSASASEIMAAAIKDYGGTVVGKKSFGKGVVQELKSLRDGTYLKLTISEYFSPKGNKIHKLGVTPDIEIEDNKETKEDEVLNKAIETMKELIKEK